jgi:hypothetical protein
MTGKTEFRVVQDSKHAGTVTRQQIDKVIREIEAEHFARKQNSGSTTTRSKNNGGHAKH